MLEHLKDWLGINKYVVVHKVRVPGFDSFIEGNTSVDFGRRGILSRQSAESIARNLNAKFDGDFWVEKAA